MKYINRLFYKRKQKQKTTMIERNKTSMVKHHRLTVISTDNMLYICLLLQE